MRNRVEALVPSVQNEESIDSDRQSSGATIGVILGQIGTPSSPTTTGVRQYLRQFLSDQRVIDLPRWRWLPILHTMILPTRPKHVAKAFAEIWTEEGSPLQVICEKQKAGIQERLGSRYQVELGLMYSPDNIETAVRRLQNQGIRRIVILPMFPQYSNSTTAAIYDEVFFHALGRGKRKRLPKKMFSPTLRFIHPYFDDPRYIEVLGSNIQAQLQEEAAPDRVIFSFHGLPARFVEEGDPYKEHVETTIQLLAEHLNMNPGDYETGYQSRFGRAEWIKPYLQPRLEELSSHGIRRPVIVSPGFTADCLETLHELAIEGRDLYQMGGGDPSSYRTLKCLNTDPAWLDYAAALIEENTGGW